MSVMERPAVRWLTYPGNKSHMVGQPVGPTTMRDYLTAVEATYDPKTDSTRVGFAYGLPEAGESSHWYWDILVKAWVSRAYPEEQVA